MTSSRSRIAAALLLALTGCIPAYVSPTRDDAARVTLVPQGTSRFHVSGFADGKVCRTRMSLAGNRGLKEKTEIRVAPDAEFTVLAQVSDPSRRCDIAVSFVPKARESYAAVVDGDTLKCKLAILRSSGKGFVPEPTMRKRAWSLPMFSNDQAQCSD